MHTHTQAYGHHLPGPAIIINDLSTIIIEPGCTAHITHAGDVRIDVGESLGYAFNLAQINTLLTVISHHIQAE